MIDGFWLAPQVLLYLKIQPSSNVIVWNVFSFTDGFMIYIKCAFLVAILFTLPVALYHVWAFVKPSLTEKEPRFRLALKKTTLQGFLAP